MSTEKSLNNFGNEKKFKNPIIQSAKIIKTQIKSPISGEKKVSNTVSPLKEQKPKERNEYHQ
jgi:hypothetical protein